eukprot:2337001-Karenia_brevis.AAC.1
MLHVAYSRLRDLTGQQLANEVCPRSRVDYDGQPSVWQLGGRMVDQGPPWGREGRVGCRWCREFRRCRTPH